MLNLSIRNRARYHFQNVNSINVNNSHARLAICLCIDNSDSMNAQNHHPINELNAGLRLLYKKISLNQESRLAADIAIVTFGHNGAECIQDFREFNNWDNPMPPRIEASGMTPMGEAVNIALNKIEERREEYQAAGVQYYHPWLILMSDGKSNGNEFELKEAIRRTNELVDRNKLIVFPVGVGKDADRKELAKFSKKIQPLPMKGANFQAFFEWLSESVEGKSGSRPGDTMTLPRPDAWAVMGWGEIMG